MIECVCGDNHFGIEQGIPELKLFERETVGTRSQICQALLNANYSSISPRGRSQGNCCIKGGFKRQHK